MVFLQIIAHIMHCSRDLIKATCTMQSSTWRILFWGEWIGLIERLSCWPCITDISCKNFLMYCKFLFISVPLFSFAHFFKHIYSWAQSGDDMVFVGTTFQKGKKKRVRDIVLWVMLLGAFKRIVTHKNISSCCSGDHRWSLGGNFIKRWKTRFWNHDLLVKQLGAFQKNSWAQASLPLVA